MCEYEKVKRIIYETDGGPERIFSFPYRNYITLGKQDNCYEEFYIYSFPKTNSLTVERHIFNFTEEIQNYDSYEGVSIKFKLN